MSELRGPSSTQPDQMPPASLDPSAWLAAIVESSFDAIVSKTLDGVITSWNSGAEQLFGHSSAEAVGQPIAIIIPPDRLHEEADILARIRDGHRVDRFETVRVKADGTLIEIEVTVSPVRNASGEIVGASKIARGIGERKQQLLEKDLIIREMHHRIQNLFAITQGLVKMSRRSAGDVQSLADNVVERLASLSAAHQLILPPQSPGHRPADLAMVLRAVLAPYSGDDRIYVEGPEIHVGEKALTSVALLIHELATNAVKYGGLSADSGAVEIDFNIRGDRVELHWRETVEQAPDLDKEGFGTDLLRAALRALDGQMDRSWRGSWLRYRINLARNALGN